MAHSTGDSLEERGGAGLKVHCKDHWERTEVKVTVELVKVMHSARLGPLKKGFKYLSSKGIHLLSLKCLDFGPCYWLPVEDDGSHYFWAPYMSGPSLSPS